MLRWAGWAGTGRPAAVNAPALTRAGSRWPGACPGTNIAERSTAGTTYLPAFILRPRLWDPFLPHEPSIRNHVRYQSARSWDCPGYALGGKTRYRILRRACCPDVAQDSLRSTGFVASEPAPCLLATTASRSG